MALLRWYPIHELAVTIELDMQISPLALEKISLLKQLVKEEFSNSLCDLVPAYTSLTLCFKKEHSWKSNVHKIEMLISKAETTPPLIQKNKKIISKIPVCYELNFAIDLLNLSAQLKLSTEKIINLHLQQIYIVYAVGFIPGFPYMGEVLNELNVPRKVIPTPCIPAGSVAIANNQTGIYPFEVPGGWHVIGRTPLSLFDKTRNPLCLLEPGDQVQFFPISKSEFDNWA